MKKITITLVFTFGFLFCQTKEQVNNAKKMIKQSNMTESEVKNIARSQGFSETQIEQAIKGDKKQKKFETIDDFNEIQSNLESSESKNENSIIVENEHTDSGFEMLQDSDFNIESSNTNIAKRQLSYFGYNIFKRDPKLFQATSVGAVDPDYLISAGDEIIVMLWGETQFRQVLAVDREGFIFLPEIGQVFVNGLNLNLLESKLFRVLSQSYASLNPQGEKATTFLDVSLGNLRPLRIQVLGEVAQPGAYTVSPSATLFSALYYFKGPTNLGSLRDIRLIRGGKELVSIDFYDYLLTGKKPKDQKLQLDDVIFIPKRLKTVTIDGEINRPGIYELKPKETLKDLINIARGLSVTAYTERAQIDRIVPSNEREQLGMDRMITDVVLKDILDSDESFSIQDGDRIQIFSIMDLRPNTVMLKGAVARPGTYDLGDSLRLSDLIMKADSLLGDAYLERIDVIRTKPDFTKELIRLDLEKVLEKDIDNDILLQSFDQIRVYGMSSMISSTSVSIDGHVKRSGTFALQDNMRVYDLLFLAGGHLDPLHLARTFLNRADLIRYNDNQINKSIIPFNLGQILEDQNSEQNFILQPGDHLRIYSKNVFNAVRYVTIEGSVRKNGKYELKSGMSIKDLILEAGGLSENTYKYKIEVARIDSINLDEKKYAEIIELEMDNDYYISNDIYKSSNSSSNLLTKRDEFYLEPYDYISIRPDPFFSMQNTVKISGAVYYPGNYTIIRPDENIADIIDRAGGLRTNAYPFGSIFKRDNRSIMLDIGKIVKRPKSKSNISVRGGDEIIISIATNVIELRGEINAPGLFKFNPNTRVSDAIKLAGGLTENANKKQIFVSFPNGTSKKYHRLFRNYKLRDGSIISISKAPEEEPFDKTEYAKELTSILANLAQVISIFILASGSN